MLYTTNHNKIDNFTIYGERHSGTKLLKRTVQKSFGVPAVWNYGWKHFFGPYNERIISCGKNTLFLGIVRDPYDWTMAMFKKPYHVPHYITKDIESFLFSEWLSVGNDGKEKTDYDGNIEDRNYKNGERFKNIFELRQIKNEYLYSGIPIDTNYFLLSYEELTSDVNKVLSEISQIFNLNIKKHPPKIHERNSYPVDDSIKKYLKDNISWGIENKMGYYDKDQIK